MHCIAFRMCPPVFIICLFLACFLFGGAIKCIQNLKYSFWMWDIQGRESSADSRNSADFATIGKLVENPPEKAHEISWVQRTMLCLSASALVLELRPAQQHERNQLWHPTLVASALDICPVPSGVHGRLARHHMCGVPNIVAFDVTGAPLGVSAPRGAAPQ